MAYCRAKAKKMSMWFLAVITIIWALASPIAHGDSIYNGANDDAAGTTAVMMLAKYFSELKNNERTLIFVAFTAEEIGGIWQQIFQQAT